MTDYQKYINALRKCAKEHENDITSTGHIIISDLCRDTANLLETLEQEPRKGHWKLVQRGKEVDICCSKCEAARIKGYAYGYTIDQLKEDLKEYLKNDDMRYCPNCGAKMDEPQESEDKSE